MPNINPRLQQLFNEGHAAAGPGGFVLFKWTCQGCQERVTFTDVGKLYTSARHDEKADGGPCGYVTDLNRHVLAADVGYTVVLPAAPLSEAETVISAALLRRDQHRGQN